MTVGEQIKKRRDEAGLSVSELARRGEISKGYLSDIENSTDEKQRPSADLLF
ncbi:MAG: helix-turn-helix domain-containing protein, partial [Chloroflexota bacterium]